jgi:cytochrome c553
MATLRSRLGWLRMGLLCGVPFGSGAAADLDLDARRKQLERVQDDPGAVAAARSAGEQRAAFCKTCHGTDGISTRPWIPNLAGQNVDFLLEQIVAYATGSREDYVMNELAASFLPEDVINLSLFYASMPNEQFPEPADPEEVRLGEQYYASVCQACHGADGRGEKGYSWLAGQKPEYIRRALERYRERTGGRLDPTMVAVTHKLTDEEIDSLAAYISTMR